jgi:Zn-dependent peptidase ImmA (M78 family)
MSGEAIENFVEKFREIFGLGEVMEFPVVRFVEWVLPQVGITMSVVEDWELEGAYAVADTSKGVITVRNTVYEGAVKGNPRDRFTICHEIGHAVLHTPDRVEFARGDVPAYRESEWQANRFASALLAPRSLAMGLTVEQIEECFKISHEAAVIRYGNLHR